MTKAIILTCRSCGGDCDSSTSREGRCFLCVGRDLVKDLLAEQREHLLRRLRYAKKGGRFNDSRIARTTNRIRRRLSAVMLPQHVESVVQRLSAELEEQLRKEIAGAERIQLARPHEISHLAKPRPGELVVLPR